MGSEESFVSDGDDRLDLEHRQVLRRVRQFAAAAAERRPERIPSALKFLQGYLGEHFAHEETGMAEAGYPGAREHERLHAAMLDRFDQARRRAKDDPRALVRAAADLAAALEAHIRTDDVKLSRFSTARENLRLLAEAGPGVGAALTPLPGSHATVRPARAEPDPYPAAAVAPRTMK
jgi:hemerythrin-like metal-binding protein